MDKENNIENSLLVEAVLVWTGRDIEKYPHRKDSLILNKYGDELGNKLLALIKSLKADFYSSDAKYTAADVNEMGIMSSDHFKKKHPEIDDEIVSAFAWCYTFDFK